MSEYRKILENRLDVLKTDYVTALTNIERVGKDLEEAKTSATEMLGAIKNLELLLVQFSKVDMIRPIPVENKTVTESTVQKQEDTIKSNPRLTPKIIKKQKETKTGK